MSSGKIIGGVLILIVLIGGIYMLSSSNKTASTGKTVQANPATGNSASNAPVKFSDTQVYPYSYLISGDSLSSQAQKALAGFSLSHVSNSDSTTTYTLTALKQGYVNQTYTLQAGQSLYFIETSFGDDSTADNSDLNLGDDHAVVVDSNGYIV